MPSRSNRTIRLLPVSATYRVSLETRTARGSEEASLRVDEEATNFPSVLKWTMRWFQVSATQISPRESTLMPQGSLNWPFSCPLLPNCRTNWPLPSRTWTRVFFVSAM